MWEEEGMRGGMWGRRRRGGEREQVGPDQVGPDARGAQPSRTKLEFDCAWVTYYTQACACTRAQNAAETPPYSHT
jgi:hypothetical protein